MKQILKDFTLGAIIGTLVGLLMALTVVGTADASDFGLLDLNELSVDYRNFAVVNDKARNLLIYPDSPKEAINVGIKTDLLSYLGWDSTIEALTTSGQYRSIGLQTALYARITGSLEVGYYHHSQHLLERSHSSMPGFPVEDALTVKIYLFRAKPARDTIF